MIDHRELADMLPGLGPGVFGASFTPYDGHANPLDLLHALHKGLVENGGATSRIPRSASQGGTGDFRISTADGEIGAPKMVLAAGLGNAGLTPLFGLNAPVDRRRARSFVTERAQHVLPMPTTTIRQTVEGGIMLGDSQEDVGFDTSQKPAVMEMIARVRCCLFRGCAICRSCAPGRRSG